VCAEFKENGMYFLLSMLSDTTAFVTDVLMSFIDQITC
jgi:hypothetical protein